jgi:hypothetical protein
MANNIFGTEPNQVPTNADLGTMAFQDARGVNIKGGRAILSNVNIQGNTTDPALTITQEGAGEYINIASGAFTVDGAFVDPKVYGVSILGIRGETNTVSTRLTSAYDTLNTAVTNISTNAAALTANDARLTSAFAKANAALANTTGTFAGDLTLTGSIFLGNGKVVDFIDQTGNKVLWYSNTYGTGIETGTLTHWANDRHRFRLGGTDISTGTAMVEIDSAGMTVNGTVQSTGLVVDGNANIKSAKITGLVVDNTNVLSTGNVSTWITNSHAVISTTSVNPSPNTFTAALTFAQSPDTVVNRRGAIAVKHTNSTDIDTTGLAFFVHKGVNRGDNTLDEAMEINHRGNTKFYGSVDAHKFLANGRGSQSQTSFTWQGEENNGMFSPGANSIAFSTNSQERLRISSANVSFYQNVNIIGETNTANLYVGGNSNVNGSLNVTGSSNIDGSLNVGDNLLVSGNLAIAGEFQVSDLNITGDVRSNVLTSIEKKTSINEFNFSDLVFLGNTSIATLSSTNGLLLDGGGRTLYTSQTVNRQLRQFRLSAAWNVRTTSSTYSSYTVKETAPAIGFWSPDGERVYYTNEPTGTIHYVRCTSAYNVGTGWANAQEVNVVSAFGIPSPSRAKMSADGTKLYILSAATDSLYQVSLTNAWNVKFGSVSGNLAVSVQESAPYGMTFTHDGMKLIVCGTSSDDVFLYKMSQPWNINTAVYSETLDTSFLGVTQARDVEISPDGSHLLFLDLGVDRIYQWDRPSTEFNVVGNTTVSGLSVLGDLKIGGQIVADQGFSNSVSVGETLTAKEIFVDLRAATSGSFISFYANNKVVVGSITGAANGVVSYNSFLGSHWSQFSNNSNPPILRGTVLETIDEMCTWDNFAPEDRLAKVKVSDTPASNSVYGTFLDYDEDNTITVASLGAGYVRVEANSVISRGNLVESNGDGSARVQSDNIIRASTVGKISANVVINTFEDGSRLYPCILMCG